MQAITAPSRAPLAELDVGAMLGGGTAVAGECARARALAARACATGALLYALPAAELAGLPPALLQRLRDEARPIICLQRSS